MKLKLQVHIASENQKLAFTVEQAKYNGARDRIFLDYRQFVNTYGAEMWNHRLVTHTDNPKRKNHNETGVYEVFYTEDGKPWLYGEAKAYHSKEWKDGQKPVDCIRMQLARMLAATGQPVLRFPEDFVKSDTYVNEKCEAIDIDQLRKELK